MQDLPLGLRKKFCPWHTPPHWFKDNPMKGKVVFTIVRNPYTRIIFEYYCNWRGFKGSNKNNATIMNEWIWKKIEKTPQQSYYGHLIPQHYYVYNKLGRKMVKHVLRFENLTEEFQELMEKYSLNITLGNKTNARGSSALSVENLTRETIDMVNDRYAKDFRFFNYSLLCSYSSLCIQFNYNNRYLERV